jgi:hypothetical protein
MPRPSSPTNTSRLPRVEAPRVSGVGTVVKAIAIANTIATTKKPKPVRLDRDDWMVSGRFIVDPECPGKRSRSTQKAAYGYRHRR